MRIDESAGRIVFDNITSAHRELGSVENVTVATPAEKAVACNAKGVFRHRPLQAINDSAKTAGANVAKVLSV